MKTRALALLSTLALASFASADTSVKLTDVHLCCKSCVVGAEKAVAKANGVTANVDKDAGTITLTGADTAAVQSGVDALVNAGYFGKSDRADVTVKENSGAKTAKVSSLTVDDVHLCCDKCATTVKKALTKVDGVASDTAAKKVTSFEVKGDFSPKEVMTALQNAGLTGTAK